MLWRALFLPTLLLPPSLSRLARYLGPLLLGKLFGAGLAAFEPPEPAEFLSRFVLLFGHATILA